MSERAAIDRIADALEELVAIERARDERAARRKGPRPPARAISDTDRELARRYSREAGLVVSSTRKR